MTVELTPASVQLAGILLLSLVAVAYGGTFLLRISRGDQPATDLQRRFFRAGHAHAAVFLTLALATQPFIAVAALSGVWEVVARSGIAVAAILLPAGFFLSAAGRNVERPNRFILLIWLGVAVLAVSVVTLGIGLLRA